MHGEIGGNAVCCCSNTTAAIGLFTVRKPKFQSLSSAYETTQSARAANMASI
jgi:hypothetical protein